MLGVLGLELASTAQPNGSHFTCDCLINHQGKCRWLPDHLPRLFQNGGLKCSGNETHNYVQYGVLVCIHPCMWTLVTVSAVQTNEGTSVLYFLTQTVLQFTDSSHP